MKAIQLAIILTITILTKQVSFAQENNENEIRDLENKEGEAFVKKDTTTLYRLFSPNLLVNSPMNRVVTLEDIKKLIRLGKIDVSSSKKIIETISFRNDMAIVMGRDIITPMGSMENAGKTVNRRYTDIWIKEKEGWLLTVRQATNISIQDRPATNNK